MPPPSDPLLGEPPSSAGRAVGITGVSLPGGIGVPDSSVLFWCTEMRREGTTEVPSFVLSGVVAAATDRWLSLVKLFLDGLVPPPIRCSAMRP